MSEDECIREELRREMEGFFAQMEAAVPTLTRGQASVAVKEFEKVLAMLDGVTVEEVRRQKMKELGVEDYDEFVRVYIDGDDQPRDRAGRRKPMRHLFRQ